MALQAGDGSSESSPNAGTGGSSYYDTSMVTSFVFMGSSVQGAGSIIVSLLT